MNINIKESDNNKNINIHNENRKDSFDGKNNQIKKELDKEEVKKENNEKNNLQDNYQEIDLVNNQIFNFEKDIWNINKHIENPQLRNNNFKDLLDTSQFKKEDKNNKHEEKPKVNTKSELKEIMIKQLMEKKKSYYIKQSNKFVFENDDEDKNRIFEDDSNKSKTVFDIENFNNNINYYNNNNNVNSINNIYNNSFNPNTFNNNIINSNIDNIINNKREQNIFIDNKDLNFINKIKYFNNNKDPFLKIDNNNSIINKNNVFNAEDISDKKHDFEKDIKYENKDAINEKEDNDLKQYKKYKNSITINYNPEIQTVLKKNFDKKEKNNLLNFNIPLENEDLFNPLDETLLNKIIENINKGDKDNGNYKINDLKPPIEPKNLCKDNNKSNDEYLIKELIEISKSYIFSFFELFSRITIDFSNIAFCFILDCSLYLGIEQKFDYLIYILSILKVIQMLNVKFCIFLSADDNYKVLIKKYEEIINYEDLIERIYETYIIKRFRNNLLKSVQIAMEFLKCNDRENIIFLIFSDSLDDSIIQFNYWKSNILINKNNSFIFFISKHNLAKNKQEIINNMWNNFEKKANENSNSKIKIIQSLEKEDVLKNIGEFLDKLQIKENNNKIFQPRIELKEIITNHFDEILNCGEFKEFDRIYFFNNPRGNKKDRPKNIIKEIEINSIIKEKDRPEVSSQISKKPEIRSHISKILKLFLDKILVDSIFYPNKATQKQLSTKGSEIDVLQLILYTLCPVQEPMIYLEDKGGMIRDYSITIVIDNSITCFSEFNEKHSYLTIINLLKIINAINVPSFDLIVTGDFNEEPHILIFNKPSVTIFKDEGIFEKLLLLISNPNFNTDLGKAIETAFKLRHLKKYEKESYLFVLTDGLLHKKYEENINSYSNQCQMIGMRVYGIGLGIYPYKAKELFSTFLYAINPDYLLKAISIIFGKLVRTENELKIPPIKQDNFTDEKKKIFFNLEKNNKFFYNKLREELQRIKQGDDIMDIFCNKEKITFDSKTLTSFNVEEGKDLEIYGKNILKTQKLLIVMLWSYELNEKFESPFVSPKYINEASEINGTCIKSVIEYFGIENIVVVDYESAIKELLKKNEKNECLYYSVWIFCGPQYPILPPINGKENSSNPYLVEEFINILIVFWTNGGSLVFFAEGDPLYFQVNLFLEKIEFSKNEKPEFRISGNYYGDKTLTQDKDGKMDREGIFDKSKKKVIIKEKKYKDNPYLIILV